MRELVSGHSGLEAEIRVALNGPYLVTNVEQFRNWLGEEIPIQLQMSLCRCGQSSQSPIVMVAMPRRTSQVLRIRREFPTCATPTRVNRLRSSIIGASVLTRDSAPTG